MNNSTRWTLVAVLIAVNAVANVILGEGWLAITIGVLTGLGVIAVVVDFLVRGRRES